MLSKRLRKRLAVWVPLGKQHGLGHYFRNLGLVTACPDAFYISDSPEVQIAATSVDSLDPQKLEMQLHRLSVGVLLIDHYFLPSGLVKALATSPSRNFRIIYFAREREDVPADAFLNSNPFATARDFALAHAQPRYFIGSEFYWPRPEICEAARGGSSQKLERLFVCLGGADRKSLLLRMLPQLRHSQVPIVVVVGPACTSDYVVQLEALAKQLKLDANILHAPANFAELLCASSYALLSSSTVCYEALFFGCRILTVQTEENQRALASFLSQAGVPVVHSSELEQLQRLVERQQYRATPLSLGERRHELLEYIEQELAA